MFRRLFVSVLVAALALVVAPRPSSGLEARDVRPQADDHRRCMYRCEERGVRKSGPRVRLDTPIKPLRHFGPDHWPGCPVRWWPWHGQGGWGQGGWDGDGWPGHHGIHNGRWCPRPIWRPRPWPRPCWCGPWHRPRWHDRYDHWHRYRDRDRDRDRDGSGGYDHHRSHPRGRDF